MGFPFANKSQPQKRRPKLAVAINFCGRFCDGKNGPETRSPTFLASDRIDGNGDVTSALPFFRYLRRQVTLKNRALQFKCRHHCNSSIAARTTNNNDPAIGAAAKKKFQYKIKHLKNEPSALFAPLRDE